MAGEQLAAVPEVDKISFPGEEERVQKLWDELDVFNTCLKQSKGKPKFTFYDGPPFATGLPHYGHILAGTIKDIVTRWAHQSGYHVERRFGWDTHGLPVEYEIDKTHNIKTPEDVAAMGIKKYNQLCRDIVMRYSGEWKKVITRVGRWIDFDNDYKTLYPWYMESIWWVFGALHAKGLVYRGVKVMPFSTACSTPLSNFEAGQNYRDVQDPSVVVTMPILSGCAHDGSAVLVAWTTTPWTLPSNLALCVSPDLLYVKIRPKAGPHAGKVFVMMQLRVCQLFKSEDDYTVLETYTGRQLEGSAYTPLFPYFQRMAARGAFRVLCDAYVSADAGTGVVHQAPYFGEDDFRVCLKYGVISRDGEVVCPVDDAGRFTAEVPDFAGTHVKEADKAIIKLLREQGRLVVAETLKHSYPFCWRSDTPLIYRAVPSWFVRVEHMQEKLLASNDTTKWVPEYVKDKRFANWLKDARDWAISRNRYWGTPIPLWVSDDLKEVVCVSSIAQLEELSGCKISDIHRDSIDHITIPSKTPGNAPLKRISEVFDCWFESGSMPYAQCHFPFENADDFDSRFPADFIAEGIDQTRGWFYTLMVISTALFGRAPFKNLICNGLVLATDGQKMSKSKKNFPDPMEVVGKYGADALRLYLANSPAVRGENLRFKEDEVFALLKEVFIPWLNAYRYFVQQVTRLSKDHGIEFSFDPSKPSKSSNVMDRWILSFTQSLLTWVHQEMGVYRLYTVTPRLVKFVDNLTNWYVRFNRKRLKGDQGPEECQRALESLYEVLLTMVRVMAPFTPFICETMYQNLRRVLPAASSLRGDSVHYLALPRPRPEAICAATEAAVAVLQSVVESGRYIRDSENMPIKYPLPEVVIIHKDAKVLEDVRCLEAYIRDEVNVRKVSLSTDKDKYGVSLKAEINFKKLGAKLKGDVKKVQEAIHALNDEQIGKFLKNGSMDLAGHEILDSEVSFKYVFSGEAQDGKNYKAHGETGSALVLLDTTPDESMRMEGLAREVVNRIQKLKKKAGLVPTDEVTVWFEVSDASGEMQKVVAANGDYIQTAIRAPLKPLSDKPQSAKVVVEDNEAKVSLELRQGSGEGKQQKGSSGKDVKAKKDAGKEAVFRLCITKDFVDGYEVPGSSATESAAPDAPACQWVNVVHVVRPSKVGATPRAATVLLENPVGTPLIASKDALLGAASRLFGLDAKNVTCDAEDLRPGSTVYLTELDAADVKRPRPSATPFSRYLNIAHGSVRHTLLLEGGHCYPSHWRELRPLLKRMTGKRPLYRDVAHTQPLLATVDVALAGQTLYC